MVTSAVKNPSNSFRRSINNLRSQKTPLIFICCIFVFSLVFFLNSPLMMTSSDLFSFYTISATTLTSHILSPTSVPTLSFQNGSGLVLASQKTTPKNEVAERKMIPVLPGTNQSENGSGLVTQISREMISPVSVSPSIDDRLLNGSGLVTQISGEMTSPVSVSPSSDDRVLNGSGQVSRKTTGDSSCDIFDGKWVFDNQSDPIYSPGSCPHLDYAFNCFNNGRSDIGYLKYRWQPHGCNIPRFDGRKMLKMLRGKRMVFVGDSLNRNMWESMVCSLRNSILDKKRVFEVSGRKQYKAEGFYSFVFKDYNCRIDFIRSPFLVQEWKLPKQKSRKRAQETLRLDMMHTSTSKYHDADFLIFNTGHWWSHYKTKKGENYFQEGDVVYKKLNVEEAYTKAFQTWGKWVDNNVNSKKTKVFFAGYSSSHFRGGQWNSGGNCDGETEPITNDKFLTAYPKMMKTLEVVMAKMSTPVVYLNTSKLTGYRKDGHPSKYGQPATERLPGLRQDCSHWCLPGVPDTWNQLLFASLLLSSNKTH